MSTPCVPTLTELDLLQAPLWMAEQLVIMSLEDNMDVNSTSIQPIKEFTQKIRSSYSQHITQANFGNQSISTYLHRSLMTYYSGLPNLVPDTALSSLHECLFIIPTEPVVRWEWLVGYFLSVHNDLQAVISQSLPPKLLQDYIRIQFVTTLSRFAVANTSYDHTLVKQALDELMLFIQKDAKVMSEAYWKRFDRLPLKRSLLELQATFSSLRFDASQARIFGIPSSMEKQLSGIISNEVYAASLTNWTAIHELKRDALQAELALENDERLNTSDNLLIVPLVPRVVIIPAEADKLFTALSPYVVEVQRDDLKQLLTGESIQEKITIMKRPMSSWCYALNQACVAGHIKNSKIELMNWVAHWFNTYRGNALKEFTADQLEDNFYKSCLPPKSNRLLYNP